jgi:hypothetical protein
MLNLATRSVVNLINHSSVPDGDFFYDSDPSNDANQMPLHQKYTAQCDFVVAVGGTSKGYAAASRLIVVDPDESDFAGRTEPRAFESVTALELLDRVENPIGFLTNIRKLLAPDGVAVLTVTKLDLLPTPLKFVSDHVIESDQHIGVETQSPVFLELFCKNFLAFAGMGLCDHQVFPQETLHPRASLPWLVRHILVIEPVNATSVPAYSGPNHR